MVRLHLPWGRRIGHSSKLFQRFALHFDIDMPIPHQRLDGRQCNAVAVDLKERPQFFAPIAAPKTVGAERHKAPINIGCDHLGQRPHIVADRDDWQPARQLLLDMTQRRGGGGRETILTLDRARITGQLRVTGSAKNVAGNGKIGRQNICCANHFIEQRTRTNQPNTDLGVSITTCAELIKPIDYAAL